ncbi:hypothetical protein CC85DRAFT_326429 [Cutaneotrichosporon oleaginosum]|uniref:Uncharacterized protein n=1 Tax=Cutaneotrichosporon oleaginosum TaxID=879819 RepID=A0A0J0XU20_9TREE|nr:uncharacterized protein CC85DRAFT_326429 [Cutaneotrichosporon oleaginosum]KLT44583.1 hypothetical protein CC85DRAFT_326429 [Cutaneotrichosporon oleaginosum]TXT13903.1 hypothetical protein COLE_00096 [Cutaneotrichosporon oleaginosum]
MWNCLRPLVDICVFGAGCIVFMPSKTALAMPRSTMGSSAVSSPLQVLTLSGVQSALAQCSASPNAVAHAEWHMAATVANDVGPLAFQTVGHVIDTATKAATTFRCAWCFFNTEEVPELRRQSFHSISACQNHNMGHLSQLKPTDSCPFVKCQYAATRENLVAHLWEIEGEV